MVSRAGPATVGVTPRGASASGPCYRAAVSTPSILKPGTNCWQVKHASRIGFLIDGAAYFRAFREAVRRARRSILVLGWGIDAGVQLAREPDDGDGDPSSLADLLDALVRRTPELDVHVLVWDFAVLQPLRKWRPVYELGWRTHERVRFRLDSDHPVGGSHHQKIVVVDDRLAFVGGLDLAFGRWDTPAHDPDDERRDESNGRPMRPFHDMQMVVSGVAARATGDLARERWRRATGETLEAPEPVHGEDFWPASAATDLRGAPVAIARTDPAFGERPEVREVEQLHVDSIRTAQRCVYIENQYLTSGRIASALEERLFRH